jgi:DNA-binding NtrC family response regulator
MKKVWALVVCGRGDHLISLRQILDPLVKVSDVRTCEEAARYLEKPDPPHLVFTDTAMSDGSWLDVLKLAAKAPKPVNVIVASRAPDVRLYMEAMDEGAFDYVTASSLVPEVAHVLRSAAENVLSRREAQERLRSAPGLGSGKRKSLRWSHSATSV